MVPWWSPSWLVCIALLHDVSVRLWSTYLKVASQNLICKLSPRPFENSLRTTKTFPQPIRPLSILCPICQPVTWWCLPFHCGDWRLPRRRIPLASSSGSVMTTVRSTKRRTSAKVGSIYFLLCLCQIRCNFCTLFGGAETSLHIVKGATCWALVWLILNIFNTTTTARFPLNNFWFPQDQQQRLPTLPMEWMALI